MRILEASDYIWRQAKIKVVNWSALNKRKKGNPRNSWRDEANKVMREELHERSGVEENETAHH